jgi:hypothetical protein
VEVQIRNDDALRNALYRTALMGSEVVRLLNASG